MKPETVAKVAVFKDGKVLVGKRNDDGKWCCPGGHPKGNESPHEGARRELAEETGLKVDMLRPLDRKKVKNGEIEVHAFKAEVDGEPSNENDPDAEFTEFRWVDPKSIPNDILRNLHSNPDVVLETIGASGPKWSSFEGEAA
jgi:8-oxo-dGTP pyrophosphatase MutT (NUDIX family)